MPTTLAIHDYLLSNSPWVTPGQTVDTVKAGDPSRPVSKAGVCWFPDIDTLRAAHQAGCQLLIVHEPTFWEHSADETHWRDKAPGDVKQRFLEETGLVILRCHDAWDNWPEIGVRDSWARGLGLTRRVREGDTLRWHAMYEIEPTPLRDFAQDIADRIHPLGEDCVQVIGDPKRIITRPALGVGCVVPGDEMVRAGADVLIMCYDGACYWNHRERMAELGAAMITVEHGTSEMWAMESLRDHLAEVFPDVEFIYLAEHPRTWTVRGQAV